MSSEVCVSRTEETGAGVAWSLTPPLILPSIALVVNLLLDEPFVGRVVGVQDLDSFPSAFALVLVADLKGGGGDKYGHGQALGVDTSLHDLLRRGQVRATANDAQREGHRCQPRATDDPVSVLPTPVHGSVVVGLARLGGDLPTPYLFDVFLAGSTGGLE